MPHEVPPLPYAYNALEPHIDEQTMRIHHDKHHGATVAIPSGKVRRSKRASRGLYRVRIPRAEELRDYEIESMRSSATLFQCFCSSDTTMRL